MRGLLINCTLGPSNTEALAGVESEMGEGDEWPGIRAQILAAEILVFATPTRLGRPSSIARRVLEPGFYTPPDNDDFGCVSVEFTVP